jgi:hypothetical protein
MKRIILKVQREINTKKIVLMLCILIGFLFCNLSVQSNENASPDVTAAVDCKEVGRLNGEVEYQYDATLTNNTDSKLIVTYEVIFMAGDVRKKTYNHSTVMIPNETLTETHDGKISEEDWDKITRFRIEWSSQKQ